MFFGLAAAPSASADTYPPGGCNGNSQLTRCAGTDRVATAIVAASQFGTNPRGIFLVSSENYADALACGAMAVRYSGPLLVTPGSHLDPRVEAAIQQIAPARQTSIILCGGSSSLAPSIYFHIQNDLHYPTYLVAGNDRYETAVRVAGVLQGPYLIVLADGTSFQDALTGAYIAAKDGGVLLLTNGATMPAATQNYINQNPNMRRVVVGVAANQAYPVTTTDPKYPVEHFSAGDPFSTNQAAAQRWCGSCPDIVVVSGDNWVDALGAVPLSLRFLPNSTSSLYKPSQFVFVGTNSIPSRTYNYLVDRRQALGHLNIQILGGTSAVSDSVATQLASLNP
jgi:putative cell wall-binding protein